MLPFPNLSNPRRKERPHHSPWALGIGGRIHRVKHIRVLRTSFCGFPLSLSPSSLLPPPLSPSPSSSLSLAAFPVVLQSLLLRRLSFFKRFLTTKTRSNSPNCRACDDPRPPQKKRFSHRAGVLIGVLVLLGGRRHLGSHRGEGLPLPGRPSRGRVVLALAFFLFGSGILLVLAAAGSLRLRRGGAPILLLQALRALLRHLPPQLRRRDRHSAPRVSGGQPGHHLLFRVPVVVASSGRDVID